MKPVLIFDVNETLLDLAPMRAVFTDLFGSPEPLGEWFARLLHGSLVANHLDDYRTFGSIGVRALLGLAARRGVELDEAQARDAAATIRDLPPHPEVPGALGRLHTAGFRLATLTNGDPEAVGTQLANASLDQLIEAALSVEASRRFKPDPAPYVWACRHLDVRPANAMLVAAHDWDIAGAHRVGMKTAFVMRPGVRWNLPGEPPGLVVEDLLDLTRLLTEDDT